jgi:hypothetical protein
MRQSNALNGAPDVVRYRPVGLHIGARVPPTVSVAASLSCLLKIVC